MQLTVQGTKGEITWEGQLLHPPGMDGLSCLSQQGCRAGCLVQVGVSLSLISGYPVVSHRRRIHPTKWRLYARMARTVKGQG